MSFKLGILNFPHWPAGLPRADKSGCKRFHRLVVVVLDSIPLDFRYLPIIGPPVQPANSFLPANRQLLILPDSILL